MRKRRSPIRFKAKDNKQSHTIWPAVSVRTKEFRKGVEQTLTTSHDGVIITNKVRPDAIQPLIKNLTKGLDHEQRTD